MLTNAGGAALSPFTYLENDDDYVAEDVNVKSGVWTGAEIGSSSGGCGLSELSSTG